MSVVRYPIKLNVKPSPYPLIKNIALVQNDTANVFAIELLNNKEPFNIKDCYVTATFKKSDKNVVVSEGNIIDEANGLVDVPIFLQAVAYPGKAHCTIEVYNKDKLRLTSIMFEFTVVEELGNNEDITSVTEYTILQELVNEVQQAKIEEEKRVVNENARLQNEVDRQTTFNGIVDTANTTKDGLDVSIINANTIEDKLSNITTGTIKKAIDTNITLNTSLSNAEISKTNLDASINDANTSKINLDTSIDSANTAKSNLDNSISTADTTKIALDGSITEGNVLKGDLNTIISGTDYEQIMIDVNSLKTDQHNHANKTTLDNLSDADGKLKYSGQDVGIGDMTKAEFDTDNDGIIDKSNDSDNLGGQLPSYYATKAELDNKIDNSRVLTDVPVDAKFTDTITPINDTLTSISIIEALSANQGKVLGGKINNLSTDVDSHKAKKATQDTLGHVKAGKNVTIQIDGTLDVDVDTMIKFNRNPTSDDIDYDTGQLWFNEDTGNIYVLFKIDKDGSAIWRGVNNADLIYPLKIYGVRIDMNNSNPLTSVVYTDDAVNMSPAPAGGGISEWDNVYPYSEIKPCLLKSGEVQTYLNPNNLAQKADGTPADITTGDNGDVMVEFPVIYWKIWREGQYLYVKYANYKIDSTWKALAHTKRSTLKDNIYIGAFLGYELSGKLRSLSGKTVTANKTIGNFRILAQANGGGYSQMPYFAVLMLQILYLIKYKSRDSQTALGRGFVDGNSAGVATGGTITKGVDFGETLGKQQMKFLNIEDFWGNYYYWLDGLVTDSSYNLLYSNDNFNDSGTGYEKFTTGLSTSIAGYIDDVWGNTETGFIIKSKNGSATTHFCDYGDLDSGKVACFGGYWDYDSIAGFAQLPLLNSSGDAYAYIAARLFYA